MEKLTEKIEQIKNIVNKVVKIKDTKSIYKYLLKQYTEIFECDGASHVEFDGKNRLYTRFTFLNGKFTENNADDERLTIESTEGFKKRQQREIVIINDVEKQIREGHLKDVLKQWKIQSYLFYPEILSLVKNNSTKQIGFDVLLHQKKYIWKKDEVTVFIITSNILNMVLKAKFENEYYESLKNDFLAAFTHDIKSPIMSIQKALEGLIYVAPSDIKAPLKDIFYMNIQTLNLIKNMLTGYNFETGKFKPDLNIVKLNALLDEEVRIYQYLADEKEIKIHKKYARDLPGVIACKESAKRVFSNILSNAVKFTPKKGSIYVETYINKYGAEVSIMNEGMPINKTAEKTIFNKFETDSKIKSTGLGLYISKILMKYMKGRIRAKGLKNGTVFLIEFKAYAPMD